MPFLPALGTLLVALFEVVVGVIVKIMALRFALQVAYVAIGAGITYGIYVAIDNALQAWVVPAAPAGLGTALYLINWSALSVLVSLIIGVETTIALGIFALRNLKLLAQH